MPFTTLSEDLQVLSPSDFSSHPLRHGLHSTSAYLKANEIKELLDTLDTRWRRRQRMKQSFIGHRILSGELNVSKVMGLFDTPYTKWGSHSWDSTSEDEINMYTAQYPIWSLNVSKSIDCSIEDTNAAKKQVISQRTGMNWELTADSTSDQGKVNAEYILNGENIKVGSGDGATAGKAWADDLVSTTATPLRALSC